MSDRRARAAPLLSLGAFVAACATPPVPVAPSSFGERRPLGAAVAIQAPAAATPVAPTPAVQSPVGASIAEATAAHAPVTADEADLHAEEAELRRQVEIAVDPTGAALDLAALLAVQERLEEARTVLEAAVVRHPSPLLRIARAGVLRDLGHRDLAVQELQGLLRELGPDSLGPGILFELAELQWLEGSGTSALATLAALREHHGSEPWCAEHRTDIEGLGNEIGRGKGPERVRVRDLLGNLRGAPLPTIRVATLEHLLAVAAADPAAGDDLANQALAIAAADDSPAVRACAVRRAMPPVAVRSDFCRCALLDVDPFVRCCGAARAVELLRADAAPLLLAQLGREDDAAAFAAEHAALCELYGGARIDAAAAAGPEQRARLVDQWRERCRSAN